MKDAKSRLQDLLGSSKLAADLDYQLRLKGRPVGGFHMRQLDAAMSAWREQVKASPYINNPGKKVFIFSTLHYWIEHAALLGMALAGLGNKVTLGFMPYANWDKPVGKLTLRRQNNYGQHALSKAGPVMGSVSMLDYPPAPHPPTGLAGQSGGAHHQAGRAVYPAGGRGRPGYAVVPDTPAANELAAQASLAWMKANRPDVVIVPNGLILEFGGGVPDRPLSGHPGGELRVRRAAPAFVAGPQFAGDVPGYGRDVAGAAEPAL